MNIPYELDPENDNLPSMESMTTKELVAYTHHLDILAKKAARLVEDAKTKLRERLTQDGAAVFGETFVSAQRKRSFDPVKAVEILSKRDLARITETKLSGTLAKQQLGSIVYDKLTSPAETYTLTFRTTKPKDLQDVQTATLTNPFTKVEQ